MTPEYWAGFFDGEGTIQIKYRRMSKYAVFEMLVAIAQIDKTPLVKMKEKYGGSIRTAKTGVSHLTMTGSNARMFLRTIYPFLIVKREEAEIALKFADLQEANPRIHVKGRRGPIPHSAEIIREKIALYEQISAVRQAKGFRVKRRVQREPWVN